MTVPAPAGVAQAPSPRQNVDALADVPEFKLVTGRLPVTPVVRGKPVALVNVTLVGVPNKGVTKVGEVANTAEPVPVSSVKAESRLALLGVAKKVATPVPSPDTPVEIGSPVAFVKVALVGVPKRGVTNVGLVAKTFAPVPVSSVKAAAKFALLGVAKKVATPVPRPETPVLIGKPVALVRVAEVGVPRMGVTNVGLVAKTFEPVPVSSVKAAAKFALEGVAKKVATPVPNPDTPVLIGRPVAFVKVPLVGVPRTGVTRVGLVANTNEPDPVSSVIAEAKLALEGVAKRVATPVPKPLTPVEIGRPVALVKVALVGVPRIGVTSVGEFDNTTLVVPVEVVTPVPPFNTAKVPVMSAVERLTASHDALVPSLCRYLLAADACAGKRLFKAPAAVEAPVPPSATARSVIPVIVPPVIVAELDVIGPVTPAVAVTAPVKVDVPVTANVVLAVIALAAKVVLATVAVPVAAPMFTAVAAPPRFKVVETVLNAA